MELTDLNRSGYRSINNFFFIRNPFERRDSVCRINQYINDRDLERSENAMGCSKMVEVVE